MQNNPSTPSGSIHVISALILAIGLGAFFVHVFAFRDYTMDDSFITFRYARNFIDGFGLVFNPQDAGEPTEGLTSPLYAILLALMSLSGVSFTLIAKALGAAACLLAAVLIGRIVFGVHRHLADTNHGVSHLAAAGAAAYFLADQYVAVNAVSGMETACSALAFAYFLYLVWQTRSGQATAGRSIGIGVIATIVPMLRPEMAAVVIVFFACLASLNPPSRRSILTAALTFLILGTLYFAARYLYYGLPFPLPFYVKQGDHGLMGMIEIERFAKHMPLMLIGSVALFACLIVRRRSERSFAADFLIALFAAVALQIGYYATIKHIMGLGLRYFQPIIIGLIILGFSSLACIKGRRSPSAIAWTLRAVAAGILVVASVQAVRIKDAHDWLIKGYEPVGRRVVDIGITMKAVADGEAFTMAVFDCGAIPYHAEFQTIDLAGLNNKAIALGGVGEASIRE
ncbi:hypothetical protein, partial [Noviherbaspirillum sp.]|uniref:hypothetical protein n=1 Tax=Noviherbaspirillum sp. TaxID=1926288 RepID=UPI002DDCF903